MEGDSRKGAWISVIIGVIAMVTFLFSGSDNTGSTSSTGSRCGDYDRVEVREDSSSFDPDDWESTDSGIRSTDEDRPSASADGGSADRAPAGAVKGSDGNYYRYDPGDGDYKKNGNDYTYVGCSYDSRGSSSSGGSGGWIFTGGGSSYRGGGSGFGK